MRLIIVLLGMGIHIFTIGFTSSSSLKEDNLNNQIKSSMSQKDVVTGTAIKRSPTKKVKFFLVCTKEEDESLKCKPVSHTTEKSSSHKNSKKKTNDSHKYKRKKTLLHNITNESLNIFGEQISANAKIKIPESVSQNDSLDQKKLMNPTASSSTTIKTTEVVRLDELNISNSKNHNVGLDLNVIMSSVMARRHEYLQQQIEDGILESSYELSGDGDELEDDDVDNGLIDMRKVHTTHLMSSIVASDKNNKMENNHVLTQVVQNAAQDQSTPLLKATPTGVQSSYQGKQFSDVNVQKFSTSISKDIKKLITPTNVNIISEVHRSRTSISKTTKNESSPVIETHKSNLNTSKNDFYKFEFGSENDSDIVVPIPKGRDKYRIFEYPSFNAKEAVVKTTLSYHDIHTTLYLSAIKSPQVSSIKVSSSTNMEYTPIDGINGLFETGMEYYPIPLGKAEALLFSPATVTSDVESTSVHQTPSYLVSKMDSTTVKSTSTNFVTQSFMSASKVVDEFECIPYEDKGTVFDFDPIESRKQDVNLVPAKSNNYRIYDEFVSAYQKVSGNAEIDLTEDTDDILNSNIAHEANPDFIPALKEFNKDEEQTYGSWPSLVNSSDHGQRYSIPYNEIGNSSENLPFQRTLTNDDAKKKPVTPKDDFFLLKRNDISAPEPAISKARRRTCHPRQVKPAMIESIRTSVTPLYGSTNGLYMSSTNLKGRTESALATISSPSSVSAAMSITPTRSLLINPEHSPLNNSSTREISRTPTKSIRKIIFTYRPTVTKLPDLIAKINSLSSNPRPPTTKANTAMKNTTRLNQLESQYLSPPTHGSTLEKKTTNKGSASWRHYGPDSTSKEICGKNFLIQMKLPPEVHRYSKTEIKQKIEDAIAILYRLHDSFQSSKVVWVDDVSSEVGPAVGVDVELYFVNRGCKHLDLLQNKLKEGWMGELALSSDGIMYALLDDRIADSSICPMPCSNPYNCFPTCNKECCENPLLIKVPPSPKPFKGIPNRPTNYDSRNIKYPKPIQYPTPAFLVNINRNNGNNQMNKNILYPQAQKKCDSICGWLCVEGCSPYCCVPG